MLAAPVVRPWYFLSAAGVAALLPGRAWAALGVALAVGANLSDLVEQYFEYIPWVQDSFGRMVAAPVVVTFVPAAAVLLAAIVLTRSILLVRESSRAPATAQESRVRLRTEPPAVSPARTP
jgi:hypothetical protein